MPAPKRTLARNTAPMAPSCTVPQHSLPRGLRLPLLPIAGGMPTRTSSNLARLERRLGLVEEGQTTYRMHGARRGASVARAKTAPLSLGSVHARALMGAAWIPQG